MKERNNSGVKDQFKKPLKEKDIFEKQPKKGGPKARPKKGEEKEEGLFEATDGKIKEGGLHRFLRVDKDFKFRRGSLVRLLKVDVGEKFSFEGNEIKMTERGKKQIQLAVNMMKSG